MATYTLVGDPQAPTNLYVDEGPSFNYAKEVTEGVKDALGPYLPNERARKRLLVKVWRDNSTRTSHPFENVFTRGLAVVIGLEVLFITGVTAVSLIWFPEDSKSAANGAAYAGLAAGAAFFSGHLAVRVSKLAQPFEFTKAKTLMVYLPIIFPMLLNLIVVTNWLDWFFKLFAADWEQLSETYGVVLAVAGLFGTVFGATVQGAWDVLKWALLEEAQRTSPAARSVIDLVERRQRVEYR